jgi:hypothetical protein
MLVRDAAVGAVHPGLEVGDRAMHPRHQVLAVRDACDLPRTVLAAELDQALVGEQPVGMHDRPTRARGRRKRLQSGGLRAGSTCSRRRPEPGPRTSITAPISAFLPC